MYKHFSDWLKNLDTGCGWYLTTEELETWLSWKPTRVPPPTDTHTMHYHNHHLKKKKKPACHHRCLENMLASVSFPTASVET